MAVSPQPGLLIYCDPPYINTTGYAAAGAFDSAAFYARAAAWSRAGSVVFVSEYACPVGLCVWERQSTSTQGAGVTGGKKHVERLYRI